MENIKIGLADSGIGGLSILIKLQKSLPANFYYTCDHEFMPYGDKDDQFIFHRLKLMFDELISKKCTLIIIACNTATTNHIDKLRSIYKVPIVGVEPFVNFINSGEIDLSRSRICLFVTPGTYKSPRLNKLLNELDPQETIDVISLPKLATSIQKLWTCEFKVIEMELNHQLDSYNLKSYTHAILGCTHYHFLSTYLKSRYGLKSIEPSQAILNRVIELSPKVGVQNPPEVTGLINFSENCGSSWRKLDLKSTSFYNLV